MAYNKSTIGGPPGESTIIPTPSGVTPPTWDMVVSPVKENKKKDNGPFWIRSQDNAVIYGEKPEKRGKDHNRRGRP